MEGSSRLSVLLYFSEALLFKALGTDLGISAITLESTSNSLQSRFPLRRWNLWIFGLLGGKFWPRLEFGVDFYSGIWVVGLCSGLGWTRSFGSCLGDKEGADWDSFYCRMSTVWGVVCDSWMLLIVWRFSFLEGRRVLLSDRLLLVMVVVDWRNREPYLKIVLQ